MDLDKMLTVVFNATGAVIVAYHDKEVSMSIDDYMEYITCGFPARVLEALGIEA